MTDTFLKRMDNWRRTVRSSSAARSNACATWARLYIAARARDGNGNDVAPPRSMITVDELDGWLVEACVSRMMDHDEKTALRLWYVWQYPEHWIKARLQLRRTAVRLVLARAENNLRNALVKLGEPAIIPRNNSHAGVDPRLESDDALRALLTLAKEEDLID